MSSSPPDDPTSASPPKAARGGGRQRSGESTVEVLETLDLSEFEVARGLLEAAGIKTVSSGDGQAGMLGTHLLARAFTRPNFVRRAGAIRISVAAADAEAAHALLNSESGFEPTPELDGEDES